DAGRPSIGSTDAVMVDEDGGLFNGNPLGPGDALLTPRSAGGSLDISWGSDNFDTNDGARQDGAGNNANASSAALTGRAVFFSDNSVTVTGALGAISPLTSRGETVLFRVVDDGT